MKYKKQIAIICLITFLFLPMSGKYEEPKAEILTLSAGTVIACAALATVAGVIITNPYMLEDVGTIVYDGIKNIPNAIENVGNNIKLNVTKDLLNTVVGICNTIPKVDKFVDKVVEKSLDESNVYSLDSLINGATYTCYFPKGANYMYLRNAPSGNDRNITIKCPKGYNSFRITVAGEKYTVYFNGSLVASGKSYVSDLNLSSVAFYDNFSQVQFRPSLVEEVQSVCIPYTEENTKNVSADKPLVYFPTGSGSISVPIDTPLSNYNPSVDNPISLPGDLLGEGDLVADEDTSVDVPDTSVDVPNTGDSVFDKFGSWLGSLLSSLFSPLVDLLQSILDFLKGLVIPGEWNTLDFSPLYFSFADKFPFCIPFDLIRMVKEFNAEAKEPVFYVDMSGFSNDKNSLSEVGFTLDLTEFDELITIVRTLTLISFVFFLALKTRDIIKG